MWQSGHVADTMSMSSDSSVAQSCPGGSGAGSGAAAPFWLTFLKHPFPVVHAGRPYWDR